MVVGERHKPSMEFVIQPGFCLFQVDDHRNRKTTIRLTLDARHGISFRRWQLRTGQFERFDLQVVNQDVTDPEQGQLQRQ